MTTTRAPRTSQLVFALAALALAIGLTETSWAARLGTPLTPTEAAPPRARGRALVVVPHGRGAAKLLVLVHGLPPRERFEITADGVKIGTIGTTRGGNGLALFSSRVSRSKARARLLGFDPRGVRLAVVNANGEEILVGQLPGDTSGKIACCVSKDGAGPYCARVTPGLCASVGGTPTEQSACAPDPCAPPPTDVVCCLKSSPDGAIVDAPVRCDAELSPAMCADAGGTVVEAASCTPNPCEPIPPPEKARCCLPDDGTACEDRAPRECVKAGGRPIRAESCDPNPCETAEGACCIPSSAECAFLDHKEARECRDGLTPSACSSAGGTFVIGAACSERPCGHRPPPLELVACCLREHGDLRGHDHEDDDAICKMTTRDRCEEARGEPTDARSCRPNPCEDDGDDDDDGHHKPGGHKPGGHKPGWHGGPPWRWW